MYWELWVMLKKLMVSGKTGRQSEIGRDRQRQAEIGRDRQRETGKEIQRERREILTFINI
jgi:hypothetical protein